MNYKIRYKDLVFTINDAEDEDEARERGIDIILDDVCDNIVVDEIEG